MNDVILLEYPHEYGKVLCQHFAVKYLITTLESSCDKIVDRKQAYCQLFI
jgi:hypothetical protein